MDKEGCQEEIPQLPALGEKRARSRNHGIKEKDGENSLSL
jgi:hypothetical protein